MALIKCNECGKEISDKATNCIHCGWTISKQKITMENDNLHTKKVGNANNTFYRIVLISILVFFVIGVIFYITIPKNYLGIWEHTISYNDGSTTTTQYSYINFKKNKTFEYSATILETNQNVTWKGTYEKNKNKIFLSYNYQNEDYTLTLYLRKDNTICFVKENCDDYFFKKSYKGDKNIILENKNEIEKLENFTFITYDDFFNYLSSNNKTLILLGNETCEYTNDLKPILNKIATELHVEINYLQLDMLTDSEIKHLESMYESDGFGTPTIFIIQNNEIINFKEGYDTYEKYYSFIKNSLGV